jgi:hypothetical protein
MGSLYVDNHIKTLIREAKGFRITQQEGEARPTVFPLTIRDCLERAVYTHKRSRAVISSKVGGSASAAAAYFKDLLSFEIQC